MFVAILKYKVSLDVVDRYLVEHRNFLEIHYKSGALIASGPQNPRTGGVILAKIKTRQEFEEILASDPFAKNGIATSEVYEFTPVKFSPAFEKVL